MDIDEPETTTTIQTILHMPSPIRPTHAANQSKWLHVRPSHSPEHTSKRKRTPEDMKHGSIQDMLQMHAKKAKKERTQTPTAAPPAFGTTGSRVWRKGLMDSVKETDAWRKKQ